MAPPRIQIDPGILVRARALYENGTSLDVIGRLMGVSGPTVRNRAVELGWSRSRPTRPQAPDDQWPDAPPPMREPAEEDSAPGAIVARLGRLIAREMLRTETYDHSPEAAARTLVMLSRSTSILHAIHGGAAREGTAGEEKEEHRPRDYDAPYRFVADIVARMEQLCDERGEQFVLDNIRFLPALENLTHLVVRDRRRAKAEAAPSS